MRIFIFSILAILAGAQLPLAFAPFNIYLLAFIAPALLLALWVNASPKQALGYGFLFGLGCFSVGVYWVYNSVHVYGNAPPLLAFAIASLLIVVLALFPAIQGYLLAKLFPRPTLHKCLLTFPISWTIFEWLRSWILTGFPWLFLGYTQLHTPLKGIAPILGVYGVSFAVVLTSAAIVAPFAIKKFHPVLFILPAIIAIWVASSILSQVKWTYPIKQPIKVSIIQGNIPQEIKWQENQLPNILSSYKELTEISWANNLIVWPEAAIPAFNTEVQPFLDKLNQEAKQHNTTIILGIPIENPQTGEYYNGMLALGNDQSIYLKRHLVPFGEYPMFAVLAKWFMKAFHIPMSSFTPGPKKQSDFIAANTLIAPSICYEIAYPSEVAGYFPKAEMLVNISDDSWFGRSIAAAQQLQMAQMRSLETGRYQLIAANTGLTAIIKPNGEIEAQAPMFQRFIVTGTVQAMGGSTPWVTWGGYL